METSPSFLHTPFRACGHYLLMRPSHASKTKGKRPACRFFGARRSRGVPLPPTPLCVCVPSLVLVVGNQKKVELAVSLEGLGVDVIQTEGKFSLDPSK